MNSPKISIITICYNAENYIERTIKSVVSQDYQPIEYIIIDGQSNDKTLDIIEKYKDRIHTLVSEPDKNLYDAMNKGLKKATGYYVLFLNAGDKLINNNVLSIKLKNNNKADLIYSKALCYDDDGNTWEWHKKTPGAEKLNKKSFKNGMIICHQCMLVKRDIAPLFELTPWKVSSDLDWTIKVYENANSVAFYNDYFCLYLGGGISNKQKWTAVKERFFIVKKHFGLIPAIFEQFKIVFQILIKTG